MPASIRIIPLGDIDSDVLDEVGAALTRAFGAAVTIGESQPTPKYAFSPYVHQFSAPIIVHKLATTHDASGAKTLGVIAFDLFAPQTNYVFGEAQVGGEVAVISLYRLLELDRHVYFERAAKEAIHEIGHTFGLGHCDDDVCVMHFSHTIEDTDIKTSEFCTTCRVILDRVIALGEAT